MKVLLVCAGGMSTSMLMKKMKSYAEKNGIADFKIAARGADEVDAGGDYDIVLLGPQISYRKDSIKKVVGAILVDVIPMRDYGRGNCESIFRQIDAALGR
ncbi:MAG: PTS sugar transporter subunit IIB [Atopobiaceae bacterium]|nr:PTS sugar transporter subunit IIB [Atopobiaceae bacterium]